MCGPDPERGRNHPGRKTLTGIFVFQIAPFYITEIAKSSGGLRIIGKIAGLAGRGIGKDETIGLDRLKAAAKLLGAKA